ncbi:hypothetical protein CSIM01_06709 [Colletotrichum simmondsii]|uniref:Uncharacterized protein n=1 Tax=Colletotrichum simmondsii TaxID=703756 RepID=A0A135SUR4_9PEZI|nr:hypothetical protein CSIM01_06709 [Colletotrichum simmondsii]
MSKRPSSLATQAGGIQKDSDVPLVRLERFLNDLPTVGEALMLASTASSSSTTLRRTEDMKVTIRNWEELWHERKTN